MTNNFMRAEQFVPDNISERLHRRQTMRSKSANKSMMASMRASDKNSQFGQLLSVAKSQAMKVQAANKKSKGLLERKEFSVEEASKIVSGRYYEEDEEEGHEDLGQKAHNIMNKEMYFKGGADKLDML